MSASLFPTGAEMSLSHLDDKMELAVSPYPQADDIDFDLEPVRQQSIDRSMADDAEIVGNNTDPMQADVEDIFNDDDMLDDDTIQQPQDTNVEDLNMESYETESYNQDDEILYDEDNEHEEDMGVIDAIESDNQEDVELATQDNTTQDALDVSNKTGTEEDYDITQSIDTNSKTDLNKHNHIQGDSHTDAGSNEQPNLQEAATAEVEVLDFAVQDSSSGKDDTKLDNEASLHVENADLDPVERPTESQGSEAASQQPTSTQSVDYDPSTIENGISNNSSTEQSAADSASTLTSQDVSKDSSEPLHPVTIEYLDQEMSLFPPMVDDASATFFVSETSLAYEPIEKLLASCREILGDSLEHDDELVIDIPALGLHICEDSKYAAQITLSQVLDVYLTLLRNENAELAPLYCNLSSRVCLASQYAYLASSAAEGKSYTDIAADYIASPDDGAESYQDDTEDAAAYTEEQSTNEETIEDTINVTVDALNTQNNDAEHEDVPAPETANQGIAASDSAGQDHGLAHVASEINTGGTDNATTDLETHTAPGEQYDDLHEELETEDIPQSPLILEKQEQQNVVENIQEADYRDLDHQKVDTDDNESVSSHTVEGEDAEELNERVQSAADAVIQSTAQILSADDANAHDDPELLIIGDEYSNENEGGKQDTSETFGDDILESSHENHFDVDEEDSHKIVNGNFGEEIDYAALGLDDLDDEAEIDTDTVNVPITPSKTTGVKRKASDEEEKLDFLDFSTPEPKRSRPL